MAVDRSPAETRVELIANKRIALDLDAARICIGAGSLSAHAVVGPPQVIFSEHPLEDEVGRSHLEPFSDHVGEGIGVLNNHKIN